MGNSQRDADTPEMEGAIGSKGKVVVGEGHRRTQMGYRE